MKISYNWLKEYVNIETYEPSKLADMLTMAGIEVEDIQNVGNIPETIIVGEIRERKPHPNADKLSVCSVFTGNETLQIVCGAPNCNPGVKAPLALLGTEFTDPDTGKIIPIKKCKLRGVESYGMLCSEKELGLTTEECSGIMELPKDCIPGTLVQNIFPCDVIFDFEITPNRPDWLSHWGIAREIHALTGNRLSFPHIQLPSPTTNGITKTRQIVNINEFELCPVYTARIIKNVTVKESPEWLKRRLSAIGLRPINNIVDITNFVLHELGHPLHAFDYDLLSGKRVIVRRARKGEKLLALDEKEYELDSDCLVIADEQKPVALAGIMGGEETGVTEKTVNILLESAAFNASNIRKTSRKLGISSDSSYRFERGIDFTMIETASNRAASLILKLAGGEISSELINIYKNIPKNMGINCRFNKIRSLIGIDIKNEIIVEIFEKLGLSVTDIKKEMCTVTAPSYRPDLTREADLAEEVIRIYGLDKLSEVPISAICGGSMHTDAYCPIQYMRNHLISFGLTECITYTLVDKNNALASGVFEEDDIILLSNPISSEQGYLRTTLLNNMIENVSHNISRNNYDLSLFELGTVFCANSKKFPEEHTECCIALTGKKHPERFSKELGEVFDFFDLKGIIEALCESYHITDYAFIETSHPAFDKNCCALIKIENKNMGYAGLIVNTLTKNIRLRHPLFMAVFNADILINRKISDSSYKPLNSFPATDRDVAFITDETVSHNEIIKFIKTQKLKFLEEVKLFDIFRDEKAIGKGKKSMAYKLIFRHPERTLTDKEVNREYEKIRKLLEQKLNVQLR